MNILSRKDAISSGRKHYFTGKPCPYGHFSKRYVITRKCGGCCYVNDQKRYRRDTQREKARSRNSQRAQLPAPTRPCPKECEICEQPPKKRTLHMDHDHTTGIFRGWLCGECNMALGKFGDSVTGLLKALLYLQAANQEGENR